MADLSRNKSGVDLVFAATLVGHHVLTTMLLKNGLLSESANIVIAGSESARGDVPGMGLPDFDDISKSEYNDDMAATLEAFARGYSTGKYNAMKAYSIAKLYVAWWASRLAEKLPEGMRVFAISPGSVPSTNFARHQSFVLRRILMPLMSSSLGKYMGMAGPVSAAAKRYISAVDMSDQQSGKFFASPAGKMIGTLTEQKTDLLANKEKQKIAWNLIVNLAGGFDYSGKKDAKIGAVQAEKKSA